MLRYHKRFILCFFRLIDNLDGNENIQIVVHIAVKLGGSNMNWPGCIQWEPIRPWTNLRHVTKYHSNFYIYELDNNYYGFDVHCRLC